MRILLSAVFFGFYFIAICPIVDGQILVNEQILKPGQSLTKGIKVSDTHQYKIQALKNEFFQICATQTDIDVVLSLYDSSRRQLRVMDNAALAGGFGECISWISEKDENYILEVKQFDQKSNGGQYILNYAKNGTATDQDRLRVQVERKFVELLALISSDSGFERDRGRLAESFNQLADEWKEVDDENMSTLTRNLSFLIGLPRMSQLIKEI